MVNVTRMTRLEVKSTVILSLIFAFRLLGLFMILPILALYETKIPYATPALIGLAAGIYGFSQALLQLPYGILSDYLGRRPVIIAGLLLFALGSLLAAFSQSIWGLIIGRALQGAGAIGSPLLALVSDVTRDQVRTRAMALMGMTIGATFILAILLGPILDASIGLKGIFLVTALLAVGAIFLLWGVQHAPAVKPAQQAWRTVWHQKDLWCLNINIFILHAVLTAIFLVLPSKIHEITGLSGGHLWRFYLPVLSLSVLLIAPFLRHADHREGQKNLLKTALILLAIAIVWIAQVEQFAFLMIACTLFFVAFNFLEASFPALISQLVPASSKGAALGTYACSQFLGMFIGGLGGGLLQQWLGSGMITLSCVILLLVGLYAINTLNYFKVLTNKNILSMG